MSMTKDEKLAFALVALKGALAALSQKKTFPADIALARGNLKAGIKELES